MTVVRRRGTGPDPFEQPDPVVPRDGYASDADVLFQVQLSDDLSDLVAEVVERAQYWRDLPDKRAIRTAIVALARAEGAATTRQAMLRAAAVLVAAAARIPDRHDVREEAKAKPKPNRMTGGYGPAWTAPRSSLPGDIE